MYPNLVTMEKGNDKAGNRHDARQKGADYLFDFFRRQELCVGYFTGDVSDGAGGARQPAQLILH